MEENKLIDAIVEFSSLNVGVFESQKETVINSFAKQAFALVKQLSYVLRVFFQFFLAYILEKKKIRLMIF